MRFGVELGRKAELAKIEIEQAEGQKGGSYVDDETGGDRRRDSLTEGGEMEK